MARNHTMNVVGMLMLLGVSSLDCREAISEKSAPAVKQDADSTNALRTGNVTDSDVNERHVKTGDSTATTKEPRSNRDKVREAEIDRVRRETRSQAVWQIALRSDDPIIVPNQPLYVTIKLTNATDRPQPITELFGKFEIWLLVGPAGKRPRVVLKGGDGDDTNFVPFRSKTMVAGRAAAFYDQMVTTLRVDGSTSNSSEPERIFNEAGTYQVYAAIVDGSSTPGWFEVSRSHPLTVTVRDPAESEAPYVEFFRDGRQIPPHYGRSKVDEEAFATLRNLRQPDHIERMVAFRRKVTAETVDKLRAMLSEHPDPPIADDIRHYLMVELISSARREDDRGRELGTDLDVLSAAAKIYLQINPQRKQLRRRSIMRWRSVSTQFDLDHAQPMIQILESWKTSPPFYEDEIDSLAALAKVIDEIEAPLARNARARAQAEARKAKLPTN